MHPVWPHGPSDPFLKVKQAPKRAYPLFRRFSFAIANNFLGDPDSDVKMPNFFVDVRQDLVYASGCSSRHFQSILKVKRAQSEHTPHFEDFRVL